MITLDRLQEMAYEMATMTKAAASGLTQRERKNLKETLKSVKPKSRRDQELEALLGRRMTPGQYARYALAGTAATGMSQSIAGLIENSPEEILKAIKSPKHLGRKALRSVITGTMFATAIPVFKKELDYQAAKGGWY